MIRADFCGLLEEATEDAEGLPTVGFLGTLAVLSMAFVIARRRNEDL